MNIWRKVEMIMVVAGDCIAPFVVYLHILLGSMTWLTVIWLVPLGILANFNLIQNLRKWREEKQK
jgi:hypothetical protein